MGKFKDWIKKMSIKDKIKNIGIAILSAALGICILILSIIRGRNRNTSSTENGSFDSNYTVTKSTFDRIGQGIDSISKRTRDLRDGLQSGSESISDVINDPSNRKEK